MKIVVLTLFPEVIESYINTSIIGRAVKNNILDIETINIRDFADNKHNSVDDYIYGGGAGMLIMANPVALAIKKAKQITSQDTKVFYLSPKGEVLNPKIAKKISIEENIILLCGHYEGIDQRVLDKYVDEYISIGDYILTGGEIACLVLIDVVSRFIKGVLSNEESSINESLTNGLLEYEQYTRPSVWEDMKVPDVLLSGNHKEIEKWRRESSIKITKKLRPDLLS